VAKQDHEEETMEIRSLFGSDKDIYRTIEKVITYGASQEARLKSEISEYIVTESIEEQFEKLLMKMQAAMDAGGENEVGVWVSGFYGSGKSSFTKYLGLSFDSNVTIDGIPFIQHLMDRLRKNTTKSLLNTLATKKPAAVVMLDLASEQVAGATMEEVSTVLFYKVLQWAGYSRNLKVAALERKLKKDGRYDEFTALFSDQTKGEPWSKYRDDALVVDSLIPEIAHKMYPEFFTTPSSFSTETSEFVRFENDRVVEMIEIIREVSGKEHVIFIIDEVGQYVGSRQNLILNLDGLAKNLKNIGNGKVWIIGTAQQTLTEDDKKASLNSPELYKLKDRFPIEVELEAKDIREICFSRLLGKSPDGANTLGALFDLHGQELRHNTKLVDARVYGADFDRKTFIDLYPFLPAHFDILLHLLGALAKTTGGVGLRSAIKVVQDVLIDGSNGRTPVANQDVGWLATTVTLYDSLEKDIRRGFPSLHQSVGKVAIRFPYSEMHQFVAKTVCVLQILGNIPISVKNVAGLMHPGVKEASLEDLVKVAVEELCADAIVPFGEHDGNLRFFSEKLNDIERERARIPLRNLELRRIQSEALRETYSPLPSTHLNGALAVQTGLKMQQTAGGAPTSLAGERNTVQTIVELVEAAEYEAAKLRLTDESRTKSSQYTIFLVGCQSPEMGELAGEIYRSREIVSKFRNEPDQEVKEYCAGQADRANRLVNELERHISRGLVKGSFVFRGEVSAVESIDTDLIGAARKQLEKVAVQVFDRNAEAPTRTQTDVAERFLRLNSLSGVTAQVDPLGLVVARGGQHSINVGHKAVGSIRDMIERQGSVDGKRLSEHFADAPFGWSQDTLRYLVAAMLVAGEIKLKVAGREVTVNGQNAIDALKTNNAFKAIGVSLRDGRPDLEVLASAAQRLTELTGDTVVPLEDVISKATSRLFPQLQHELGPLGERLRSLDLPGADRLDDLGREMNDVLLTDASDAPQRLGAIESDLYASLVWSRELKRKLEQGLEHTVRELRIAISAVAILPDSGLPGQLKAELSSDLAAIAEMLASPEFYRYGAEFAGELTKLKTRARDTVIGMRTAQTDRIRDAEHDLNLIPEWKELNQQEQNEILAGLEKLSVDVDEDLAGLRCLVNQDYAMGRQVHDLKQRVQHIGTQRVRERVKKEQGDAGGTKSRLVRCVKSQAHITKIDELNKLIADLQLACSEIQYAHEFEVIVDLSDNE
jgi:hypothetical protein